MQPTKTQDTQAAILARVIQAEQADLPLAAAKAFLKFGFTKQDRQRMHELAVKNQEGRLDEAEQHALDSYRRVGRWLDLLAARARWALAKRGRSA